MLREKSGSEVFYRVRRALRPEPIPVLVARLCQKLLTVEVAIGLISAADPSADQPRSVDQP
jgi:hypothetical protein